MTLGNLGESNNSLAKDAKALPMTGHRPTNDVHNEELTILLRYRTFTNFFQKLSRVSYNLELISDLTSDSKIL